MLNMNELRETAILNAFVLYNTQSKTELQGCLEIHGIGYDTEELLNNTIKAHCRNLELVFKKHNVNLFTHSTAITSQEYTLTKRAREFCYQKLQMELIDENGELESIIIQHPNNLEREEYI